MKKLLLALALALAPTVAFGQCTGVFPANTLCGNLSGSPAPPGAFSASGTVVGPGSSTVNNIVTWNNTSGTQIKDSGVLISNVPLLNANNTLTGNNTFSGTSTFNNTVSGTGISSLFASPPTIGSTTASTGVFTNVDSNVLNSQTANYTIATTDCGKTIQAGTGSTGQFTVTLPSVAGFSATCTVWVVNQDTGRGKILSGFPTGIGPILYPLQALKVEIVNGAWIAATSPPPRWKLTANTSFFVNNSTGVDTNDGLASGGAFLTIQKALDTLSNSIDLGGFTATIQATAGQTYTITNLVKPFVGQGNVVFDGATTATVNAAGGDFLSVGGGSSAPFTIQNVTLASSGAGNVTVFVQTQGYFIIGAGVTFGSCGTGTAHMAASASGAVMQFITSYTISGSCPRHILASNLGLVQNGVTSLTVTLTGTPAFSTAFIQALDLGQAFIQNSLVTYSGAATGTRYLVQLNSVIDTTGGGANFFPGSIAGSALTGGQYN